MKGETIFYGGEILTMEDGPAPEAVLVRDGVIAALGGRAELRAAAPAAEEFDLAGQTMLPAFPDPHSHLTDLASTLSLAPLGTADSFDAIVRTLREYGAERPDAPWVVGFGYDHNVLDERTHPTRQVLDAAFPDRPVLISHSSGHMGAANSAALAALGITADTPDPAGGRIGREEDGRTPNGYLEEGAFFAASAAMPAPTLEQSLRQLDEAQDIYLSNGITLVQDGATDGARYRLLQAAAKAGRLRCRVVSYADRKKAPELAKEACWQREENHLRLGGWKIFLDGSPQGRTAWMLEPYLGQPEGYVGYPIYTDDQVTDFVKQALTERAQLLAHCNGDAAAAQYIRCCRRAQEETGLPVRRIRPVMIHAQLVRREQLAEMAKLGILPSFFAAHVWYWGDIHLANFGPERAEAISPLASALELGLPFTLHQDTPVIPPNVLETVWCAVNRVTRDGVLLGPRERISPREALKAVTIHAAYQYFLEDELGSITPGKRGDFAILDGNPLTAEPMSIRDIRVTAAIQGGRQVWPRA